MVFKPHEFQTWAAMQIVHRRHFGLLLAMGLGKTVITLTALEDLFNNYFAINKCLIIAPLRVARETWSRELDKWDHLRGRLRISKILGTEKERLCGLATPADIYIINRENLVWLINLPLPWEFDCVIIDELSSFKSHQSKRFKALRTVLPKITRLYGLTGTPAPNGLLDLWAQIYLFDQGVRLGPGITKYRAKWFTPILCDPQNPSIVWKWAAKTGASDEIYKRISDITASVESGAVKLPARIDTTHLVDIPMTEYNEMLKTYIVDDILAANAAVAINKLLQICNGFIYDEAGESHVLHDDKLNKLEDLIEAAVGRNVLVYYQYECDKQRILERFQSTDDFCVRELKSPNSIAAWMSGDIQVGVAHAASCGHGLNLQDGGNIIIWYGVPWSLELYQQANARLHRQGQKETVYVHHILARDTVDEDVLKRLHGKDIDQRDLLYKLLRG